MQAPYEAIMQTTEADLVSRCQRGDLKAFEEVYHRYEQQVYRYAYHLLGHREDADDIKQETFLRAYQAIGGFRRDASLQTWLLRICANLCRDKMRSWDRRKVSYDADPYLNHVATGDEMGDPAIAVERAQTTEMILNALNGIPLPLREAFVLHDIEGLDYSKMAQALGCSHASAKLRVFRARRTLKERVQSLMRAR